MTNEPIARYTIGSIITKDLGLWKRFKALQNEGYTVEFVFRRGIEELEQDSIKGMSQNNTS